MAPSRLVGAPTSREGRRGVVIVLNWRDIECRVRFFGPQVGRGDKSGGSRLVASRDIECRVTLKGTLKEHLTVAHFVVVAPPLEKTCSSLHCASPVVLRFLSLCSVYIL